MPLLSAFTPCGHLRCSSRPPTGYQIYKSLANSLGGPANFSMTPGSRTEAILYADAMGHARIELTLERMKNQLNPLKCVEMLPVYEKAYGLIPRPTDTIQQRQAALAAAMLIPAGASFTAITAALQSALGSDFIAFRVTPVSEAVAFPASPGAANSPAKWTDRGVSPQIVRLSTSVAITGTPTVVGYETILGLDQPRIAVGEDIVMSVNNIALTERVTITAVGLSEFVATFTKPHAIDDIATTSYFPYWTSTKKHSLVVVTPTAAVDPEKRRLAHEVMKRTATTWSTWDIVPKADATHTAAFTVADATLGRVGYAGLGSVTYP